MLNVIDQFTKFVTENGYMHSEKGFAESFNFLLFTRENFSPIKEMELNTSFAAVKLAGSIIGQNIPPPHKKKKTWKRNFRSGSIFC